jgi:hypothetical protein
VVWSSEREADDTAGSARPAARNRRREGMMAPYESDIAL